MSDGEASSCQSISARSNAGDSKVIAAYSKFYGEFKKSAIRFSNIHKIASPKDIAVAMTELYIPLTTASLVARERHNALCPHVLEFDDQCVADSPQAYIKLGSAKWEIMPLVLLKNLENAFYSHIDCNSMREDVVTAQHRIYLIDIAYDVKRTQGMLRDIPFSCDCQQ